MDQYLKDDQQQKLKDMLYGYLSDKANRRRGITSKNAYEGAEENFVNQMELKDKGSMAGALTSMASMAGTLDGKRSDDSIVPRMSDNLYKSTQGAYENFRTLRDSEERSNMNDLNVARYVSDLERADDHNDMALRDRDFRDQQYKDMEPRRKLEMQLLKKKADATPASRKKFERGIIGPNGGPVVLDEAGNPTPLPTGYKLNERDSDDPNADMKRQLMQADIYKRNAETEHLRNKGTGPVSPKELGIGEKQRLDNVNDALESLADVEKMFSGPQSSGMLDRGKAWLDNATTMGDTSYDLAANRWKDAIGRMQSGGQIGQQEGRDFLGMFPKLTDAPAMKREKIMKMRGAMNRRLQTLGQPMTAPVTAPTGDGTPAPSEVIRVTKDGRKAIFDSNSKQFLRWAN